MQARLEIRLLAAPGLAVMQAEQMPVGADRPRPDRMRHALHAARASPDAARTIVDDARRRTPGRRASARDPMRRGAATGEKVGARSITATARSASKGTGVVAWKCSRRRSGRRWPARRSRSTSRAASGSPVLHAGSARRGADGRTPRVVVSVARLLRTRGWPRPRRPASRASRRRRARARRPARTGAPPACDAGAHRSSRGPERNRRWSRFACRERVVGRTRNAASDLATTAPNALRLRGRCALIAALDRPGSEAATRRRPSTTAPDPASNAGNAACGGGRAAFPAGRTASVRHPIHAKFAVARAAGRRIGAVAPNRHIERARGTYGSEDHHGEGRREGEAPVDEEDVAGEEVAGRRGRGRPAHRRRREGGAARHASAAPTASCPRRRSWRRPRRTT